MGPGSENSGNLPQRWPDNLKSFYLGATVMAERVTVSVDSDVTKLYRSATENERRKMELPVILRLCDARESARSLRDTMLEISRNAHRHDLNSEILQSILDEDGEKLRSTICVALPQFEGRRT